MKYTYKLFIFFVLSILTGCIEDNSNYDYKEIPGIKFNVGIYHVVAGEEVVISAEIDLENAPGYESEYTYEYSLKGKIISTEKTFVFSSLEVGNYTGALTVTDVNTGAKYFESYRISVKSLYDGGFLILSKDGSNSGLHFIRRSNKIEEVGDNDLSTYEYLKEYKNVYKSANGVSLEGTPVSLQEYYGFNGGKMGILGEISITTNIGGKNRITEISGLDLTLPVDITEEFASNEIPADFNPVKVIHVSRDSYLLDSNGMMYTKRWATANAYHTGFFDKNISLWGSLNFEDIFLAKYNDLGAIFTIEKDPATGVRGLFGITASASMNNELAQIHKITPINTENPSYVADLIDIKYEVIFSDYVPIDGTDNGGLFHIRRNEDNSLTASYKVFNEIGSKNTTIPVVESKVYPLNIDNVIDMVTLKNQENYAYICNDTDIYWYELKSGNIGVVKSYVGKKIKGIALQSYRKYNEFFKPVQMAIAFEDGTVEINEFAYKKQTIFSKTIFTSKENYGEIVDIIYKLGDGMDFFHINEYSD